MEEYKIDKEIAMLFSYYPTKDEIEKRFKQCFNRNKKTFDGKPSDYIITKGKINNYFYEDGYYYSIWRIQDKRTKVK